MANPTSTSYDNNSVVVGFASEYDDKAKVYFAAEDTYAKGTILGQIKRAAGTAAEGDNTGTGTVTNFALVTNSELPKIGTYKFTFTATLAGDLTDPDGNMILEGVAVTQDDATVVTAGGITFTINDVTTSGEAFVATDTLLMPVTAGSYSYAPYSATGTGGLEFASSVLNNELYKSAAGTIYNPVLVKGQVNEDMLIIDADGDADSTTVTDEIKNQLRDVGILVKKIVERTTV